MILYRDTKHVERLTVPIWLEGAPDLHVREDAHGRLFGIGDGRLVGPAEKGWEDVGDGIQARVVPQFIPCMLQREPAWCRFFALPDLQGRLWPVPQILGTDGTSLAIKVTYGPGWVEELSPHQQQAVKAARWARQIITAAVEAGAPVGAVDACQAAAEILSSVLHVSPEALAALRLLDQPFVLVVLRTAAGWIPEGAAND